MRAVLSTFILNYENKCCAVVCAAPAIVAVSIARPEKLKPMIEAAKAVKFPICVGGLGVRLIEEQLDAKPVTLVAATGNAAVEKLESICLEYKAPEPNSS